MQGKKKDDEDPRKAKSGTRATMDLLKYAMETDEMLWRKNPKDWGKK